MRPRPSQPDICRGNASGTLRHLPQRRPAPARSRDVRNFFDVTDDGAEVPESRSAQTQHASLAPARRKCAGARALSAAPLLPAPGRRRPLGPMSRRALRRLRGEQRGQEPLGPDALQFVLRDDDDAEEEGPKRGPGGRRPRDAGKEGVRVNNRFELVRSAAATVGAACEAGLHGAKP